MRRDTFFWGSLFILLGVLFLLDNANLLRGIDVWGLFWPLFLILLGLWILVNFVIRPAANVQQVNIPTGDAEKANIQFEHAAGRLIVKAGDQDDLVRGKFGGGVESSYEITHGEANVYLKLQPSWFPLFWFPGTSTTWNVELKRNYPLALSFNTGAGETILELGDLVVEKLVLKTGASATKINLPANAGYTSLRIEAGVASVEVHVPENVAARIRGEVGLGSLHIDRSRFPKQGSFYVSDQYDNAENKVDIDISSGVSSVSVT